MKLNWRKCDLTPFWNSPIHYIPVETGPRLSFFRRGLPTMRPCCPHRRDQVLKQLRLDILLLLLLALLLLLLLLLVQGVAIRVSSAWTQTTLVHIGCFQAAETSISRDIHPAFSLHSWSLFEVRKLFFFGFFFFEGRRRRRAKRGESSNKNSWRPKSALYNCTTTQEITK